MPRGRALRRFRAKTLTRRLSPAPRREGRENAGGVRRAIVAARRSAGAAAVLLEEAKYSDAAVRGRAMAELTPLASPADLAGLIEGVLAASRAKSAMRPSGRSSASCNRSPSRQNAHELVIAAINSAGGDHLALLPLAGRFGGKVVAGIVESDLAGPDPHVKQLALRAPLQLAGRFPGRRACPAVRNLHRPRRSFDALAGLHPRRLAAQARHRRRAVGAAQAGDGTCSARRGAGLHPTAVRRREDGANSLRFILPYVDRPALAEPACEAVAELAHHRELRDPNKAEFQAALEKVQRTSKDRLILESVKRSLDEMPSA